MSDLSQLDDGGDSLHSRRTLIAALGVVPVASVPLLAAAVANKPDPIFALIKEAEAAERTFLAADPREPSNKEKSIELERALRQAEDTVRGTMPQTRAGTLALAEYALTRSSWGKLMEALRRELA